MKALLIEWNETTGKRAGNVNPKDKNFKCYGWQKLNGADSLEIRLVVDEKVDDFRGLPGITVLETDEEIEAAILASIPGRKSLISIDIVLKAMDKHGLDIDDLIGMDIIEIIDYALQNNLAGVKEYKPKGLKDVIR